MTRQQVPNVELARDTARSNLLTNGGFEIWQRGNGPFGGNAYAGDRWIFTAAGSDNVSISKSTSTVDVLSAASAACTFTLGTGGGSSLYYQQVKFITDNGPTIRGATVSGSIRVRTGTANAVRFNIASDGTGAAGVYSSFHTGGNTFETLTVTYVIPADATFLNVGVRFAASCTAYVDNAMLVVGSVAADYAPLHPADDLARCLRYYEIVGGNGGEIGLQGYGVAGTPIGQYVRFRAQKAAYPTFTKNGTWNATNCGQPALSYGHIGGLSFAVTTTATGNVNVNDGAANCSFTVEANP